jgi:hypothetical protein
MGRVDHRRVVIDVVTVARVRPLRSPERAGLVKESAAQQFGVFRPSRPAGDRVVQSDDALALVEQGQEPGLERLVRLDIGGRLGRGEVEPGMS